MKETGVLEAMVRADLEALVTAMGEGYHPGAIKMLAASQPGWSEAVERAEREVGSLCEALREADRILVHWRRAVGELYRLWARVREVPPPGEAAMLEPALDDVA